MMQWTVQRRRALLKGAAMALVVGGPVALGLGLRDPYHIRHYKLGLAAYRAGQYSDALKQFETALKDTPTYVPALYARGRTYQNLGDYRRAGDDFSEAWDRTRDPRILACKAYCLTMQKDTVRALMAYRQVLADGYEHFAVYNNLGVTFLLRNRTLEAEQNLTRAIELSPRLAVAYCSRAVVDLRRAGQMPEYLPYRGLDDIEAAIRLGLQEAEVYDVAAQLCMALSRREPGRQERALDYLESGTGHGLDPQSFATNPVFAAVSDHPRFRALCDRPTFTPRRPVVRSVDPAVDQPSGPHLLSPMVYASSRPGSASSPDGSVAAD
jgi:tetratricopeptide (TPR) repeat protein